jgi:hypothetical protein
VTPHVAAHWHITRWVWVHTCTLVEAQAEAAVGEGAAGPDAAALEQVAMEALGNLARLGRPRKDGVAHLHHQAGRAEYWRLHCDAMWTNRQRASVHEEGDV